MYYMVDDKGAHVLHEKTRDPGEYTNFQVFCYPPRNNYLDQLEPWEVAHGEDYYHSDIYLWWSDDATPLVPECSWFTNREGDVSWTINQAALSLTAASSPDKLEVGIDTVTPNLEAFLYRINGGEWQTLKPNASGEDAQQKLTWDLKPGENKLEAKVRNKWGREGAVSTAVVTR
jgi:hypothetical protein